SPGNLTDDVDASRVLHEVHVELQLDLQGTLPLREPGDSAVMFACEHEGRYGEAGIRDLPQRAAQIETARVSDRNDAGRQRAADDTSTSTGAPDTRPVVPGLHAIGKAMTFRYCGSVISMLNRFTTQPGPGKPPGSNATRSTPNSVSRCFAQSAAAA